MTASQNDGCRDERLDFLLSARRSIRPYDEEPIDLRAVRRIFTAGQGITSTDGKRTVPSAHVLYSLEFFLSVRRVNGLKRGVYFPHRLPMTRGWKRLQ
jgi:hypothetical protein